MLALLPDLSQGRLLFPPLSATRLRLTFVDSQNAKREEGVFEHDRRRGGQPRAANRRRRGESSDGWRTGQEEEEAKALLLQLYAAIRAGLRDEPWPTDADQEREEAGRSPLQDPF